jgi:hypothetical protein
MSTTYSGQSNQHLAGTMSAGETRLCHTSLDLFNAILDSRVRFPVGLSALLRDLRRLRQYDFDPDAAFADGFVAMSESVADSNPKAQAIPSSSEQALLRDAIGLIDFATRNGMAFTHVLAVLAHDLGELERYQWNLNAAEADQFVPKISGWAAKNTAPVGEAPEPHGAE